MAEANVAGGASGGGGFLGRMGQSIGQGMAASFGAPAKIEIDTRSIKQATSAVKELKDAFAELAGVLDDKFNSTRATDIAAIAAAAGATGAGAAAPTVSGQSQAAAQQIATNKAASPGSQQQQQQAAGGSSTGGAYSFSGLVRGTLSTALMGTAAVGAVSMPIRNADQSAYPSSVGRQQLLRGASFGTTAAQVSNWATSTASRYVSGEDLYGGIMPLQGYLGPTGRDPTALQTASQFTALTPGATFSEGGAMAANLYSVATFNAMRRSGVPRDQLPLGPGGTLRSGPATFSALLERAWAGATENATPESRTPGEAMEAMRPGTRVYQNLMQMTGGDQSIVQSTVNYDAERARFLQAGGTGMYDPANKADRLLAMPANLSDRQAAAWTAQASEQQTQLLGQEGARGDAAELSTRFSELNTSIQEMFPELTRALTKISPALDAMQGGLGAIGDLSMALLALKAGGGGILSGILTKLGLGATAAPAAQGLLGTGGAPAMTLPTTATASGGGIAGALGTVGAGTALGGIGAALGGWMYGDVLHDASQGEGPLGNLPGPLGTYARLMSSVGQYTVSPLRTAFNALRGIGDPVPGRASTGPVGGNFSIPLTKGNESGDVGDGVLPGPGRSAGLDPGFLASLQQMFADNPALSLTSGFRTYAEQVDLYNRKGPRLAARPGTSKHEKGLAADIGPSSQYSWLQANASKYGMSQTVSYEPWHYEPNGSRSASTAAPTESGGERRVASVSFSFKGDRYGSGTESALLTQTDPTSPTVNLSTEEQTAGAAASGSAVATTGGVLSITQTASIARSAGFPDSTIPTVVSIAISESGLNPGAIGDTGITDATWGPSVGLMQIRSYNSQRGTGGERDEIANLDPNVNMRHALSISGGGTNWRPWSAYTNGRYQANLGRVQQALSTGIGDPVEGGSETPRVATIPPPQSGIPSRGMATYNTFNITVKNASREEAERLAKQISAILDTQKKHDLIGST